MQKHSTRKRTARKPATLYRESMRDDHLATVYGLEPCEAFLLAYADEDREPRDGERVYCHYSRDGMSCGCISTGIYRVRRGRLPVIERFDERDPFEVDDHIHHYLMRIVGYVRDGGAVVWFDQEDARKWAGVKGEKLRESELVISEEEYVAEFGQTWEEREGIVYTRDEEGRLLKPESNDADRKAKIAQLQARLRRLDQEDDQILRGTERFKLEKQIFDLEHPVDVNDWSAWEEGGES